ncbi:hypothetical protein E4U60_002353 [Claviceps pazoutovae]|uniref:Uncharacterized protein n=1 Tax=Claviceps pazoutovae TaxID=1649127 RepID=A0A9P7SH66_9HYPO|nr:hypothetical protein E4U60_002353 [Claviceps pazoutovae]
MLEESSADDTVLIDEYETASLRPTNLSSANQYMASLQRLTFNQKSGIDGAGTKRKPKAYRRNVVAADPDMRHAYPTTPLPFSLPRHPKNHERYSVVIDTFLTNQFLSMEEWLMILQEQEAQLLVPRGHKEHGNAVPAR